MNILPTDLKRKAKHISTVCDILSDDSNANLARKIFYQWYSKDYYRRKINLYQIIDHPDIDFIKANRQLIVVKLEKDGSIIRDVSDTTIHTTLNILGIKNAIIYTFFVKSGFVLRDRNQWSPHILSTCHDGFEKKTVKYDETMISPQKKRRRLASDSPIKGFNPNEWISASKLRNYSMDNGIIDIFQAVYRKKRRSSSNHMSYLAQRGIIFEKKVVDMLNKNFPITTVVSCMTDFDKKVVAYEKETIKLMKNGTPIIYQGLVMNRTGPLKGSYGIPDLIVRSDYINDIIDMPVLPEKHVSAPELNGKYHYVIVDIKHYDAHLCADAERLINSNEVRANKCQLYVYSHAIGSIQGYQPERAFILARKYHYYTHNLRFDNNKCLDRLAHIDYQGKDMQFVNKTIDAINWIKTLSSIKDISEVDFSNPDTRPNMKIDDGPRWAEQKMNIAMELGEPTLVWRCGVKNREEAFLNETPNIFDHNCTAETLGISPRYQKTVNGILEINRIADVDETMDYVRMEINDVVENPWMFEQKLEISIDYEMINEAITGDINVEHPTECNNILFEVGIAYRINGGKTMYETFVSPNLSLMGEYILLMRMYDFLENKTNEIIGKRAPIPCIYHWGNIERTFTANAISRLTPIISNCELKNINKLKKIRWHDLCQTFIDNPITVNGCFNFKLKNIATRLYELGLINTTWQKTEHNGCGDGMGAMITAHHAYQDAISNNTGVNTIPGMKHVVEYNKIDCMVVLEIVKLLRDKALSLS
jgi:hypothetical protein